jgi:hypothetical protein
VTESAITADLVAVLVAVSNGQPLVMTLEDGAALPAGPFEPGHRSLQAGLRAWVERQTHHPVGYVEQLYTFADRDRTKVGARTISISYLGLTRLLGGGGDAGWRGWYEYFPWEDHRAEKPPVLRLTAAYLTAWVAAGSTITVRRQRRERVDVNFGLGCTWTDELVLQRYELLWEAGLVPESPHRHESGVALIPGTPMMHDHRRILATGISRLRAKIKYRPVVFELMPERFTLLKLQQCAEAVAGQLTHKQNFRRLIEQQQLVEETGEFATETGGRPAKLFRFRAEVRRERAFAGTKLARAP